LIEERVDAVDATAADHGENERARGAERDPEQSRHVGLLRRPRA
jgi:hypothetical protein